MKISTAQEAINGNSNDTVITPLRLKQVLNSKNIGGGGSSGGITNETDPIFSSSPAASITDEDIENWNSGTGGSVDIEKTSNELLKIKTSEVTSINISSAWTRIELPFTAEGERVGENLTLTPTGRIKIGADIDKISIQSHLLVTPSTIGTIEARLCIFRDGSLDSAMGFYYALDQVGDYRSVTMINPIVEVQENDEICVMVTSEVVNTLKFAADGYLCVEKIDENNIIVGGSGGNIGIDDITSKMSKVLYDNPDGTNTTVQLTETYNNFKYLEIFCKATDNTYAYTRIENPVDGKRATVMGGWFGVNAYFKNCVLVLSDGDKINVTQGNNAQITGTNACSTASLADAMSVVKVVGYYDENVLIVGNNGTEIVNTNRPKNIMTLYLDATINCVSQVYTHLDLSLYNSSGDKLTYENGYVKIGKDISKVKVSAAAIYEVSTSGAQHIHIDKNDNTIAWNYGAAMESGQNVTAIISPVVIDVKEGDLIDLKYYSSASNNKVGGHSTNMTYLTVEAVEDGQIITVNNTIDGIPIGSEFEYDGEEVPDGYEEVPVEDDIVDTYSTEETKTNKIWIDGKPIYRKVYQYTTEAGANPVQFSEIGITDIDTIVDISGFTRQPSSNNYVPLSYYNSSTDWANYYTGGNNAFSVRCGSSYGFGATTIIFEYTKTTD